MLFTVHHRPCTTPCIWVSVWIVCMLLTHFSLDFVELFFFLLDISFICGTEFAAWLTVVGVSFMHKLLPVDITAITHFCMEFCFYFLQCSRDTFAHFFILSLCVYTTWTVIIIICICTCTCTFFRPLDTYERPLFYVYDKTTFARSDCWSGLFFNTFCSALFAEFFSLWHRMYNIGNCCRRSNCFIFVFAVV